MSYDGLIKRLVMDHREILKHVRRVVVKITATDMIKQMNESILPASYSRVEKCTGNLSILQYFDICRVFGINGQALMEEASRINKIEDFEFNRIASTSENWFSIEVTDKSMSKGANFSIYPGAVVWYQKTGKAIENTLVVVSDGDENLYIRELVSDMGSSKLVPWNKDYDSIVLQKPFSIIGVVRDVNYPVKAIDNN